MMGTNRNLAMDVADEAIILAGGLGTRLREVVNDVPKSMAPVAGRPFLAWLLDALADQGLRRVILATGYLGDQIETALGAAWRGMLLAYSRETQPLGTGGAVALAAREVSGDTFFVLNGDTSLELDYAAFELAVNEAGARLGVALAEVSDTARYGAVRLKDNCVVGFREKGQAGAGLINAGVYWMRRSLLDSCPASGAFSFEHDVLMPVVSREPVIGYTCTRRFIDIGMPEDLFRAQTVLGREGMRAE